MHSYFQQMFVFSLIAIKLALNSFIHISIQFHQELLEHPEFHERKLHAVWNRSIWYGITTLSLNWTFQKSYCQNWQIKNLFFLVFSQFDCRSTECLIQTTLVTKFVQPRNMCMVTLARKIWMEVQGVSQLFQIKKFKTLITWITINLCCLFPLDAYSKMSKFWGRP